MAGLSMHIDQIDIFFSQKLLFIYFILGESG